MMDFRRVAEHLSGFLLMPYFPQDPGAGLELAKEIARYAETEDQVEWLVLRCRRLYKAWPGDAEVRACFCSRFKPADGITAYSAVFLEGFPTEKPADPPPKALPAGRTVTALPELDHAIERLARSKDLSRITRRPVAVPDSERQIVTQADIDKAVTELRDKRARDEAGL